MSLEDLDDRGLRVLVLAEQVDEAIDVEFLVAGQRPSRAGHRPRIAVREAASDQRQGFVADEAAQKLDVLDRLALVGGRKRFEDLGNSPGPELAELGKQLLAVAGGRVPLLANLRNQPISL